MDISRLVSPLHLHRIQGVAELSLELGFPAYLVGGFVRDALLGKPINDFDIVIEGDAIKLGRALVKRLGGRITVHARFKTATWFQSDTSDDFIDLISARSEMYTYPAALPTVDLGSLDDDLHRRDFTINAIALRLTGEKRGDIVDPLDGCGDLQRRLVRVMHPRSFIDDPTRLFRLIRYSERYGFAVESGTQALISSALAYVDKLSSERLRHELDLILDEPDFFPMLEKLWAGGILQAIKPSPPIDDATLARLRMIRSYSPSSQNPDDVGIDQTRNRRWTAWLMGLQEREIRSLGKRLHFTANLLKQCLAAASLFGNIGSFVGSRPSECVAFLDKIPDESIQTVLLCTSEPEWRQVLQKYLADWRSVKPGTTGESLILMGVPFGPRIGEILWRLRSAWLDGEITGEAGELELLDKLMKDHKKKNFVRGGREESGDCA